MNGFKKIYTVVLAVVCLCFFSGCCTSGRIGGKDVIEGTSRATGQLEATVKALDGTVTNSRERIADIIEKSRGIADGIERVEYLFNEYEREVERVLGEIDRIRNETEIHVKENEKDN
ncbi:MAG: hypothetical protein II563_09180, partial [Treponema sp.]|nr:hypothetical protein [Treponema sp.]